MIFYNPIYIINEVYKKQDLITVLNSVHSSLLIQTIFYYEKRIGQKAQGP